MKNRMNVGVIAFVGLTTLITSGCGQSKVQYNRNVHQTTVAAPLVVSPDGAVTGGADDAQRLRAASLVEGQRAAIQYCIRLARRNFQSTRYMAEAQSSGFGGEVQGYISYTFDSGDHVILALVEYTQPTNFLSLSSGEVFRSHMETCIGRTASTSVSVDGTQDILELQAPFIVDLYGN